MNSSWRDRFSPFRVVLAHSRSKNGVASLARSRSKNGVASLARSRSKNGVASLAYGAGTHTLRAREGHWRSSTSGPTRRMGPRFREDDTESVDALNQLDLITLWGVYS